MNDTADLTRAVWCFIRFRNPNPYHGAASVNQEESRGHTTHGGMTRPASPSVAGGSWRLATDNFG